MLPQPAYDPGVCLLLVLQTHLNGKYTVFGQVIDGLDTLDKLEKVPVDAADRPKQELRINRVTIHANPIAG
jgi:peptidyl-prolyl cis-trans isomerase-like 3